MNPSLASRAAYVLLIAGALGLGIAAVVTGYHHSQRLAPPPPGGYAFVANAAESTLWGFRYDAGSGWLNPTAQNLGSGRFPASLAVQGSRVYSANLFGGSISGWQISQGRGQALPGSPWPAGKGISLLLADHGGARLYATLGNALAGWQIAADGSLSPLPGSPWAESGSLAGLAESGRFLWLGDAAEKQLRRLSLQADGSPGAVQSWPIPASIDSLTLSADGHTLLATASGANQLLAWSLDEKGEPTPLPGMPYASGAHPGGVLGDSSGKFVYVANTDSNSISGWRLAASGLTPLPGSPWPSGKGPHGLRLSPEGHYLYSSNTPDKTLSGYRIDPDSGALSELPDSPVTTGYGPADVVFLP